MKRFLAVGFLVVLAAVTALTWTVDAEAARMVTKQIKWAGATPDTTFLEDESDTTRTVAVDLADWDFGLNGTTTTARIATLAFVCTGAWDGAGDSLYFAIEKSWNGGEDYTLGSLNTTNSAVLVSPGGPNGATFIGSINFDFDTASDFGLSGTPQQFRLKVAGDQGGSSPAYSGLKVFITYPSIFDY